MIDIYEPPYPGGARPDKRDIVERLQESCRASIVLAKEREAEIERLKAALREVDALAVRHEKGAIGKAQKIARAALEGK